MSTTGQIIEFDDRYIIPLENRAVSRCYVDTGLGIQFFEDGPETTIRVEGSFLLVRKGREKKLLASNFEELGTMFGIILGNPVVSATALKNGRLEILFKDETQLLIDSHPDYEAWEISGNDGLQLVSHPGGGLSIWKPLNNQD